MKLFFIFALFFVVNIAARNERGNGGDYVRMGFIFIGLEIVEAIKDSRTSSLSSLDLPKLKESLDINNLRVVDHQLIDNRGSKVDAIYENGEIILNNDAWNILLFKRTSETYKLVLHEMLRFAGVNDDNYIYSKDFKLPTSKEGAVINTFRLKVEEYRQIRFFEKAFPILLDAKNRLQKKNGIKELAAKQLLISLDEYPNTCIIGAKSLFSIKGASHEKPVVRTTLKFSTPKRLCNLGLQLSNL